MSEQTNTALTLSKEAEITDVLEVLEKQLSELKIIESSPFKTSGSLEDFPRNIKDETELKHLIKMMSSVQARSEAYNKAISGPLMKSLSGQPVPVFEIQGFTLEDWTNDINLRIMIITTEEKRKKLQTWKDKMSQFLTASQQKEMTIKEMLKDLTGK